MSIKDKHEDLENHICVKLLDMLYTSGKITLERQRDLKQRLVSVHSMLMKTLENESTHLSEAKKLQQRLMEKEKKAKEATKLRDENRFFVGNLKKELAKVNANLSLSNEKHEATQIHIAELERKKLQLQTKVTQIKQEKEAKEKPIIDSYNREIIELKTGIELQKEKLKKYEEERERNAHMIETLENQINQADEEMEALQLDKKEIQHEPENIEKQIQYVEKALQSAKADLQKKQEQIKLNEMHLNEIARRKSEIQETKENIWSITERNILAKHTLEKKIISHRATIKEKKEAFGQAMERKVSVDLDVKAKTNELNEEVEIYKALLKEKEDIERSIHKIDLYLKNIKEDIDQLRITKENKLTKQKILLKKLEETTKNGNELEKEVDILINTFLNDETRNKEIKAKYEEKKKEVKELENLCQKMEQEERELLQLQHELQQFRERKAHECSESKRKFIEAMGECKIKTFLNQEFLKKVKELEAQNKHLTKSYSLMKQDRNKYAKQIQSCAQTMAEIREKNKILENELDVLTRQSLNIEKELNKIQRAHNDQIKNRNQARAELSRLKFTLEQKAQHNVEQILEIERLNIIINITEDEMMYLKNQYEQGVEERNFAGIQLIDRNDELCILHEKANIQENIIKNGEIELQKQEGVLRLMTIELEDANRELEVARKKLTQLKKLKEEKQRLLDEIKKAKEQTEKLSRKLEDPKKNDKRWKLLEGNIPTEEQLKEKIQELEEKLNAKQEQLMEKNLVLHEITKNSDKLRKMAISGREYTFDLAVDMNEMTARLRKASRKMMAYLSELSLYKAQHFAIRERNKQMQELLETGRERMSRGEAPSKEIEIMFEKDQERLERLEKQFRERQERILMEKNLPNTITRTTAVPRPNAYIPDDDLGLPQPYFMKPFMYSQLGTTFWRSAVKPKKKEVQY